MPAALGMRTVLGHLQRTRLGQIEDLAGDRRSRLGRVRKRRTAPFAGRRHVVLYLIRMIGAAQRLALVAGLPTRLATRFAAQASGSPLRLRLLQPIARRRLAAVAAVEAKTALQLLDTLDETRDVLFQPCVSAAEARHSPREAGRSLPPGGRSSAPGFRALPPSKGRVATRDCSCRC